MIDAAGEYGWHGVAAVPSRLPGASGNREFFVLLRRTESAPDLDLTALVQDDHRALSGRGREGEYAVAGD